MLEFIKVAYCVTVPVLLLLTLTGSERYKKYCINLLVVSNILLIGYSLYLIRQLLGLYQLGRQFGYSKGYMPEINSYLMIRLVLVIFLPFFLLHKQLGKNKLLSLFVVVLLYNVFPVFSWNTFDLPFKITGYFCLLCSTYALVWLLNKLPYQSPAA